MQIELKSLDDTKRFAEWLVKHINRGQVICLVGDLGAGKTTFTQFLCKELGVQDYVTSPTFNLMNSYNGVLNGESIDIHHFDVYRIFASDEMFEIGFDDFLYGDGISIVEWANQVSDMIPSDSIWITLTLTLDGKRVLTYTGQNFEGEFK
jgi:tRNA threonylcarbamoyladenosine biosynthesis protein TsaE